MATQTMELAGLPPYTAMLWSQFTACPPLLYNLFESTVRPGGGVSHHSDKVFDMSGSPISRKLSKLKVKNIEELHRLTNDLLNMPILFHVKVEHAHKEYCSNVLYIAKNEFAVLVNTRHPRIKELITNKLTQAMQYMQEGKNFCLKTHRKMKCIDEEQEFSDLPVTLLWQ
ncbi:uncharacterized protein LOC117344075 [Pecten maximus]|uniref:uncharacterized protein LOC117344075 n=1 Tax=Pecten maximus TaxID=6579 RepID=UPI001458DD89|nr:uncharacterized protein LOC117344075 [Pecten maximus]